MEKQNKNNKLYIIITACLVAVIALLLVLIFAGGKDLNNESNADISINTEVSDTASDTDISASEISDEVSDEVSEDVSEEVSEPEESIPAEHTHAYSDAWSSNETDHWHECVCGDKADIANHAFGDWTTTKEATEDATGSKKRTCSTCGYEETATIPMLSHTHDYAKEWSNNETDHWKECKCGDKADVASHTYGEWTTTKEATEETEGSKYHTCTTCSYKETVNIPVLSHTHSFGDWKNNDTSHWKECKCDEKAELSAHNFGEWVTITEATCTATGSKKHTCTACGYSETTSISVIAHTYGDWKSNTTSHWKECSCGDVAERTAHSYTSVVTPPTNTEQGFTSHTCSKCGFNYVDSYTDPVPSYSKGLEYRIAVDDETCVIIGIGTCKDTDLRIPPVIDGYKVTAIGRNAFSDCTNLINVIIPDSVTRIEVNAFIGCDDSLFNFYSNAYYLGNENNPYSFLISAKDKSITTCTIHPDTKVISCYAFNYCTNITSITIPNGVITINENAFASCTKLTHVTIPNSVTNIQGQAFRHCSSLTNIVIPDGVIEIQSFVFSGCANLVSITLPDSITNISNSAFAYCTSLTSINIPDSVVWIGDYAFEYCTSLTSVTIPYGVTSISQEAFSHCTGLTSIVIPNSVEYIGYYAFYKCSNLTDVYFTGSKEEWNKISVATNNTPLTDATIHYNYNG